VSVIDVFPRRPLELTAHESARRTVFFRCVLVPAFVLALVALLVADLVYVVPGLVDDYRLATAGTLAANAGIAEGGTCQSGSVIVLTSCTFDAVYGPIDGKMRKTPLTYIALFQSIDDKLRFSVRYDPRAPDHISTSWGVALRTNRTLTQAAALVFFGALTVGGALAFRGWRGRARTLRAVAREPIPSGARPLRVRPVSGGAWIDFAWSDPRSGVPRTDSTRFPAGVEPYWLDADKTALLALVSPDGHGYLLDVALAAVKLTESERAAIAAQQMADRRSRA
jgi:hypothetical protein